MLCALGLVVYVLVSTTVKGEKVIKNSQNLEDWETSLVSTNSTLVVDVILRDGRESADERGRDQQASPCRNGGTLGTVNGTTMQYKGDLCETGSDVCSSRSLWSDVRLPCEREAKTCRAMAGGGFLCVSSPPHNSARECGDEPGPCPTHWRCSPLGVDFRCEPPTRFVRRATRLRLQTDCDEEGHLCSKGATCKDRWCVCTSHYEGKFCDQVINYCLTKPCPKHVFCEPRLGGFNCACPPDYKGVVCDIHKKSTTKAIKSPHFYYSAQQSSGVEVPFCFYAISLGPSSTLTIDFGDGTITTEHSKNFQENHNFRVNLLKFFLPPLMIPFSNVERYFIAYHAYENPGHHNIRVKVIDDYDHQLLFDTNYTVAVEPLSFCQLSMHLKNCALQPEDAFVFRLQDDIEIISNIRVNCTRAKYTFSWVVYNATSSNKIYTDSDLVHLNKNIDTTGFRLRIPKFNLTLGMYVARLRAEMSQPNFYNTSATTWFVISEDAPIPKIDGGTLLEFVWDTPMTLDASVTRDTSYESERELLKTYRFYWSCKPSLLSESADGHDYCASGKPYLNETGPTLVIPAKALYEDSRYEFTVAINEPDNDLSVIVSVVRSRKEALRIECMENCGEKIDPGQVTMLRASSEGSLMNFGTHLYRWSVRKIGDVNETWYLYENQTEFGFNYDMLLITRNVLNFSSIYLFQFQSFSTDSVDSNNIDFEATGRTEIVRQTTDLMRPFEHSSCTIFPPSGVSVFTNFTINCNVSVKNTLLIFEVSQLIERLPYLNTQEIWVSYDTQSVISNIRLTAGNADLNHVTSVRIIITCQKLQARSEMILYVSVLPATFLTSLPGRVFREISYQLFGFGSVLAQLQAAKRSYRIIQVIRCTALEAQSLINIEYYRLLEVDPESRKEFFRQVFVLREAMLEYLSQQKVDNIEELKHFANATLIVLRLPRTYLLTSTNQIVNAIFVNIIQSLQILRKDDICRNDFRAFGASLISMGSFILRKAEISSNINSGESKNDIIGDKEGYAWYMKSLLSNEERYNNLLHLTANVTQNIITFFRLFTKFLPVNGKGISISMDMIGLRVIKGSFKQHAQVFNLSHGMVTPIFKDAYFDSVFIVTLLEVRYNPYWWLSSLKDNIFPFVSININFNDIAETSLPLGGRIDLNPLENAPEVPMIHGKLNIVPFWMLDESHIQIYRFTVQQGGKIAIYFKPVPEKIQIVIQKDIRPTIYDFWNDAITLPEPGKENKKGLESLIIVEHIKLEREQLIYVGVIPHVDTLRKLVDVDSNLYHFHPSNIVSDEDDPSEDNEFANVAHIKQSKPQNNITLAFSFNFQIVNCYNFIQATQEMENTCFVSKSDSFTIACTCKEIRNPVFKMTGVYGQRSIFTDTMFSITAKENPVILIVMFYIISIFLGLFMWAWFADRDDRMKRGVIFLRDNNPTHGYTYVVMVFTGCRPRSGTTSKVAIQLVGEQANSAVHILADVDQPVLGRASQEWFVLKTERQIGDISWINLWHDHSGANPTWYCDKVVVHDIHTHEVWIFVASQWLAPLHGDGTMSCSIDQMLDLSIFEKRFRFREYFAHGCDVGHHGWFGMLLKRTGAGCFTRRQRVGATLAYASVITAVVSHMYAARVDGNVETQMDGDTVVHVWSSSDILNGLYAALIASPVYFALYWLFHCIEPSAHWQDSDMYVSRSFIFNTRDESIHPNRGDDDASLRNNGESRTKLPYTINKVSERTKQLTNTPIQGERIVEEIFCLPVWSVYIAWAFLIIIVATCTYVSTFQGIMFSHILSICFLISFSSAILSSMLLETVKVALIALFYSMFISTTVMTVEDRSEYVRHLNKIHEEKNERLLSERLGELKTLRQKAIYKPIPRERVQLLRKTAISEATARHVMGDVSIFLLFSIILACILYGIRHPNQCVYVHTIKNLIHSSKTALYQICNQDEFIKYINNTIIPNIYKEFQYSENPGEGQLADSSNYLIGVPRVRQVRLSQDSCKTLQLARQNWNSHCSHNHFWIEGDTNDYGPSWKTRDENDTNTNIWSHNSAWNLETPPSGGNISMYTGSGYVALLARTEEKSRLAMEHLHVTRWHDRLTLALFVEFALYNANLKVVSSVTVLGERTVAGGYRVSSSVAAVKLDPSGAVAKTIALVVLVTLMLVMVVHMRGESNRIVRLSVTRYTGNCWYALRIAVILLGVLAISLFVVCVTMVEPSLRKLHAPDTQEFVNFYGLAYWADILTVVLAIMFFLVVLELWHILSFYFQFQVMITALHVASYSILCYFVTLSIFLLAFVWTGHLLFAPTSYTFRTVWSSIIALCNFSRQYIFQDMPINMFESSLGFCRGGFYFVFFVSYMFIFRWGFAVILMEKYKKVVKFARDAWLDPILNKHVRAKVASRPFLRMKKMTRDYVQAMTALFKEASTKRLSPARFLAMQQIVSQFSSRQPDEQEDPEFLSNARSLAMAALVVSQMNGEETPTTSMARANPLVGTYFRMTDLQNKINKLNDVVTNLVDNGEI